jgi:hypothetical protein
MFTMRVDVFSEIHTPFTLRAIFQKTMYTFHVKVHFLNNHMHVYHEDGQNHYPPNIGLNMNCLHLGDLNWTKS